jgi:hypothetical protein
VEPSPHVLNSALAVGMPLLSEPLEVGAAIAAGAVNGSRRNKRYDPYNTNPKGKRKSKNSTASSSTPASPTESGSPYSVVPTGFSDPNMAMIQHAHYAAYGLAPAYSYPLGFSMPAPSNIYPPGAMFPPPGPPPPGGTQPAGPPGSPPPGQASAQGMIPYHAYSPPPPHALPSSGEGSPMQAQAQSQQAYYQYYPPPGYPSYWPPYHTGASYPPPTQPGSPTSPVSASTVASGVESQIKTGEESEDSIAS